MPLQFPARYSTQLSSELHNTELLKTVAVKTIQDCSWNMDQSVADTIQARTSFNLRSRGEAIEIEILSPSSLRITSKCAMPTQCFDWGKNRKNVEEFARYFETNATIAEETGHFSTLADASAIFSMDAGPVTASVREASIEQGSCRFELTIENNSHGQFQMIPREGVQTKRISKNRTRHQSFALTTGRKAANYKFTPRHVLVSLENVSEVLVENSRGPSSGCGRLISFVMLTLFLPPIGLIIAIYMAQQTGKSMPPSVTFFYDGKTGNKEIDECGMESIDLEDDDAALALSLFLTSNTTFSVKYQ